MHNFDTLVDDCRSLLSLMWEEKIDKGVHLMTYPGALLENLMRRRKHKTIN
jgi:hypothetical protein